MIYYVPMSITDITIDRNSIPSSGSIPVPNNEQGIESIITTSKGALAQDPQSGSIIKVLLDNGFKEKIEQGYQKGHAFTVLHIPPNPDFTLIESWNETTINDQGVSVSQPRKTYQFFRIIQEETPRVVESDLHQELVERPEELSSGEKLSGGIVENSQQEIPATPLITVTPPTQPITPILSQNLETKEDVLVIPPVQPKMDSFPEKIPQKSLSSYDLLKQKFQSGATTPLVSAVQEPAVAPSPSQTPKEDFLREIFGTSLNEWEQAKNIPARAFIYPTEYTWGHDALGTPRFHSLEEYPTHARYLRQKIASSLEELKIRGVDIETITLDRALDALVTYQLLHD